MVLALASSALLQGLFTDGQWLVAIWAGQGRVSTRDQPGYVQVTSSLDRLYGHLPCPARLCCSPAGTITVEREPLQRSSSWTFARVEEEAISRGRGKLMTSDQTT